jgi:hypothetical protein
MIDYADGDDDTNPTLTSARLAAWGFDSHPWEGAKISSKNAAAAAAAGYSFFGAYLGGGSSYLTPKKATILSNAGLQIVSIYEHAGMDATGYYSGAGDESAYEKGIIDGEHAYSRAMDAGQDAVPGSAIYFGTEPDYTGLSKAQQSTVTQDVAKYYKGVEKGFSDAANGSPIFQIGVYGFGAVDKAVIGAGEAAYSFMAGTSKYANWDIKQSPTPSKLNDIKIDIDHTSSNNYGEWSVPREVYDYEGAHFTVADSVYPTSDAQPGTVGASFTFDLPDNFTGTVINPTETNEDHGRNAVIALRQTLLDSTDVSNSFFTFVKGKLTQWAFTALQKDPYEVGITSQHITNASDIPAGVTGYSPGTFDSAYYVATYPNGSVYIGSGESLSAGHWHAQT